MNSILTYSEINSVVQDIPKLSEFSSSFQKIIVKISELTERELSTIGRLLDGWNYQRFRGRTYGYHDNKVDFFWQGAVVRISEEDMVYKTVIGKEIETKPIQGFWEGFPKTIQKIKRKFASDENYHLIQNYLGFLGFISFEYSRELFEYSYEDNPPELPLFWFELPKRVIIFTATTVKFLEVGMEEINNKPEFRSYKGNIGERIFHETSYSTYIEQMAKILDHIKAGDIYQANYTQRLTIDMRGIDYRSLFFDIQEKHQYSNAALVELADQAIVSLSPELFITISNGVVITKPIKGTIERGKTENEDEQMKLTLTSSSKDHAELSMIVDLLRNDLGKSAMPGSVDVVEHAVIETFENVHHMVSTVTAKVPNTIHDTWRLFIRAFPGGSISGVPKVKALEIIESVESVPRGVYTGSMGIILLNSNIEFNIAIRTLTKIGNIGHINAGGGIVYDSDIFNEYVETLHKAKHLLRYFGNEITGHMCWKDGRFVESESLHFDASTLERGVFETMLVKQGKIQRFEYHLQRLQRGISSVSGLDHSIPSSEDLRKFLRINLAEDLEWCKLNIYYFNENKQYSTVMTLSPYQQNSHPVTLQLIEVEESDIPKEVKKFGIKTVNYNFYRKLVKNAISRGYFDTIFAISGEVIEGGRSTIYVNNGSWVTPSDNVIEGTVRQILLDHNLVEQGTITIHTLRLSKNIAISNALNGVRRVERVIDGSGTIIWEQDSGLIDPLGQFEEVLETAL